MFDDEELDRRIPISPEELAAMAEITIPLDYNRENDSWGENTQYAYYEYFNRRLRQERVVNTTEERSEEVQEEPKLTPRKMNKLKEWSISARALRKVLTALSVGQCRYDYKFSSTTDPHNQGLRYIWNGKTNNVIATVKFTDSKIVIRLRKNSFYRSVIEDFDWGNDPYKRTVTIVESENLGRHRRVAQSNSRYAHGTAEEQQGFRRAMYRQAKGILVG